MVIEIRVRCFCPCDRCQCLEGEKRSNQRVRDIWWVTQAVRKILCDCWKRSVAVWKKRYLWGYWICFRVGVGISKTFSWESEDVDFNPTHATLQWFGVGQSLGDPPGGVSCIGGYLCFMTFHELLTWAPSESDNFPFHCFDLNVVYSTKEQLPPWGHCCIDLRNIWQWAYVMYVYMCVG